ncbi:DUF4169 family protein [Methylobacterium sp. Leaf85]|uniref:DUF4169 family protein n=1 Tax=Methylobacterium sp. Leaf85 TaxID=1736241 RepID=UPI0006FCD5B0|nr:DUF4169 family protein [Methylobacterium sp. Leaf85]KQO51717.1 hypothetical protein ASF08_02990 [Methylobacterium sp. Leaf85]
MAEIINLRSVRKGKARAEKEAKAEDNRIAFGLPKKARTLAEAKKAIEFSRVSEGRERGAPSPERSPPLPPAPQAPSPAEGGGLRAR